MRSITLALVVAATAGCGRSNLLAPGTSTVGNGAIAADLGGVGEPGDPGDPGDPGGGGGGRLPGLPDGGLGPLCGYVPCQNSQICKTIGCGRCNARAGKCER